MVDEYSIGDCFYVPRSNTFCVVIQFTDSLRYGQGYKLMFDNELTGNVYTETLKKYEELGTLIKLKVDTEYERFLMKLKYGQ